MKDTYCDYCNPPYSTFRTTATGFTNSELVMRFDEEDNTFLDIGVFHRSANNNELIYDGSFFIKIKNCPMCGRKLSTR